jgi:hypothetical protein
MMSTPMKIAFVLAYFEKRSDFNPARTCKTAGLQRPRFPGILQAVKK